MKRALQLQRVEIERWPLTAPFRIAGYTWEAIEVLVVHLEQDGFIGRSEAAGIYYKDETPRGMKQRIEALRAQIEAGITRSSLQQMLPPGGCRNALDCALWDLDSQLAGRPVWQLAGLSEPCPLLTTFTCGADTPESMAATARSYVGARAIKVKLTGEPLDADRVRAVREACPNVWLGVDANQALTRASLDELMPVLLEARVALIEQPCAIGEEAWLDGLLSPIPIAADESAQSRVDIAALVGRFDAVNIKLDKCGGLTEALAMARDARSAGLDVMVGNMTGTSLAMAPAFVAGQLASIVDLDGPVFLKRDRAVAASYDDGFISCPPAVWGGGQSILV